MLSVFFFMLSYVKNIFESMVISNILMIFVCIGYFLMGQGLVFSSLIPKTLWIYILGIFIAGVIIFFSPHVSNQRRGILDILKFDFFYF